MGEMKNFALKGICLWDAKIPLLKGSSGQGGILRAAKTNVICCSMFRLTNSRLRPVAPTVGVCAKK